MGKASAIPSELIGWAGWAQPLDGHLSDAARQLNDAIEAFNRAPQSPQFTPAVGYAGNDVLAYATQNGTVDAWVGQVGQAFAEVERAGIPPGIYRANEQDLLNSLSSASEAALAALVGGDPVQQAESAAAGARLAAQVQEAEDTGDPAQVRTLLSQLQNTDQQFDVTFFQDLGPDRTITSLIDVAASQDQNLLDSFDTALGQATQDPGWDPAFTGALLDPNRAAWQGAQGFIGDFQLDLLRYGTYSGDFLTRAGDYFLFPSPCPTVHQLDKAAVVFNALDRNPSAAYQYLTGTYATGGENLPRIQYFLRHSTINYPDDGSNQALANLIDGAGFSAAGRADAASQLLQDIGSIPTANEVDNSLRPSIERLLAGYIGNFANTPTNSPAYRKGQFPWQERLFMIAELDQAGNLDPAGLNDLQGAAMRWLLQHAPSNIPSGLAGGWFAEAGNLYRQILMPARKANWDGYDQQQATAAFWNDALGFGNDFVPSKLLLTLPLTAVEEIGMTYLGSTPADPQLADYDLFQRSSSAVMPTLMLVAASRNPQFFPPSLRGLSMNDSRVQSYLSVMAKAVAGGVTPDFSGDPALHLSPAEQNSADDWVNAMSWLSTQMEKAWTVVVDGAS